MTNVHYPNYSGASGAFPLVQPPASPNKQLAANNEKRERERNVHARVYACGAWGWVWS